MDEKQKAKFLKDLKYAERVEAKRDELRAMYAKLGVDPNTNFDAQAAIAFAQPDPEPDAGPKVDIRAVPVGSSPTEFWEMAKAGRLTGTTQANQPQPAGAVSEAGLSDYDKVAAAAMKKLKGEK